MVVGGGGLVRRTLRPGEDLGAVHEGEGLGGDGGGGAFSMLTRGSGQSKTIMGKAAAFDGEVDAAAGGFRRGSRGRTWWDLACRRRRGWNRGWPRPRGGAGGSARGICYRYRFGVFRIDRGALLVGGAVQD